LWSPIQVRRVGDGFEIENRYDFTNAKDCTFTWQLRAFRGPWDKSTGHDVVSEWKQSLELPPGQTRAMKMEMPPGTEKADAIALRVDDPKGQELWTWVWPLKKSQLAPPAETQQAPAANRVDPSSPFQNSLRIAGPGKLTKAEWRKTDDGWIELDYAYTCEGDVDFHGICFDLPEESVKSMRWLGAGPHRVWKNRLAGTTLGVWENAINDTITGHAGWVYPEFRGCYAGVRWMRLETTGGPIVVALDDPSVFVQVLKPRFPEGAPPPDPRPTSKPSSRLGLARYARADLPNAGLAILHAIPAIGNKFHRADQTGPQGQQNRANGEYRGRVKFFFGEPPRQ
jgi:hypothetical protein